MAVVKMFGIRGDDFGIRSDSFDVLVDFHWLDKPRFSGDSGVIAGDAGFLIFSDRAYVS